MLQQKVREISKACMEEFVNTDSVDGFGAKTGILRVPEFQDCLASVGKKDGALTSVEISAVRKIIPRDPFGRIHYSTFPDVLEEVRFTTMKKNILESRGTKLQKILLEECKQGEQKCYIPSSLQNLLSKAPFIHSGLLSFRDVVSILFRSSSVNLTKLQIHILLSETEINADRKIDYFQLVPFFANAVEHINDANGLIERDELVRTALDRTGESVRTHRAYTMKELSSLSQCLLKTAVRLVNGTTGSSGVGGVRGSSHELPGGFRDTDNRTDVIVDSRVSSRDTDRRTSPTPGREETVGAGRGSCGVSIVLSGDDAVVTATRACTAEECPLSVSCLASTPISQHMSCLLQVLHSPSSPELLLLRALLTGETTLVLCERVAYMDKATGRIKPSDYSFGVGVRALQGLEWVDGNGLGDGDGDGDGEGLEEWEREELLVRALGVEGVQGKELGLGFGVLDREGAGGVKMEGVEGAEGVKEEKVDGGSVDIVSWSERVLSEAILDRRAPSGPLCIVLSGEREEEEETLRLTVGISELKKSVSVREDFSQTLTQTPHSPDSVFDRPTATLMHFIHAPPLPKHSPHRRRHDVNFEYDPNGVPSLRPLNAPLKIKSEKISLFSVVSDSMSGSHSSGPFSLGSFVGSMSPQPGTLGSLGSGSADSGAGSVAQVPDVYVPVLFSVRILDKKDKGDKGDKGEKGVTDEKGEKDVRKNTIESDKDSEEDLADGGEKEKDKVADGHFLQYNTLIAKVTAADGTFSVTLTLPVKLPTLALIDREASEDFLANLLSELYLEVPHDWDGFLPPLLKLVGA